MIQLKVRTEYSFGNTFAPIARIIERLKEQGCTAAAIVDEASTWGHVPFYKACKEAGIQPMLGVELIVADDDVATRMWFIAKNKAGLSELYRASTKAYTTPQTGKYGSSPRLYRDDVRNMSNDILIFAGEVTDGEFLYEIGAIIDYSPASRILDAKKRNIVREYYNPSAVAEVNTSDNVYAFLEDRETFELMTSRGQKPSPQHLIDVVGTSTMEFIADQCKDLELPVAPMIHAEGDLEALCRAGIPFRKLDWTPEYEARLQHELKMIFEKKFEAYFLVVSDMVKYAKQHMLVGPSRGSSAGSLVCYLTQITEIDPIPPKLFFERFIDTTRSDLPDIDLDFPDNKRHMIFEYMADKYGISNTAHIGTISTYKPKSALIQVCKALGIPPSATAGVKVAMIERSIADSRANNCLEDTLTTTDAGRQLVEMYPQVTKAAVIEGHASHTGTHAAGLLVCNDRIDNYATVDANGIAHIDKHSADTLGLLKIDVLGLRTLGVLEDCGLDIDWYNLPFDDPEVFKVFNENRFCGIFQFEGNAMRSISTQIKFKSIIEIDAITALARPGPLGGGVTLKYIHRINGEKYESIHPMVEKQMADTFGLPLYQEQTMAIVREIGKFSWEQTSIIRKAVSKRLGKEYFDKFWEIFKVGALSQGIPEEKALATWDLINAMGAWQMNKAHTYSYAVISYWTAYLKAHHPIEFAAANLRNAKDEDSAIQLLREMVNEGVEYIPFDIELSEKNWSVKNGKLVGGFTSLKGIGENKADKLLEARAKGKLTAKQIEEVNACPNVFADIFPFQTAYGDMYANPDAHGIAGKVYRIEEFDTTQEGSDYVFLGEIVYKNPRNENEEVNVKKRNGKVLTGPLEFLDLRLRDDTGTIGARIGRFDFEKMGREILETLPEGTHIMVRAYFVKGIKFAFVKKWKRIDIS